VGAYLVDVEVVGVRGQPGGDLFEEIAGEGGPAAAISIGVTVYILLQQRRGMLE